LFLLERLISRSCRSLAVMIGCGQRIRAFSGSTGDPDVERAGNVRVPDSPGTAAIRHRPRRTASARAPALRRASAFVSSRDRAPRTPALKGGSRWIDASS
jgi:hypothetical protein